MNLVVSLYVDSYQNDTKNRENFKHISWSPYDRITMRKATSFKDLCAYDTDPSKMWNGVEQKMHLIGENENCNWEIINKDDKDDEIIIKTPLKEYNYYCIISLKLDYRLLYLFEKNEVNKKDLFESIDTTFKKSLDSNSNAVTYENFKSLGAEDLVIILLSDSITEIIKSVSTIKGLQCTIEESDVSKNIDIFSSVCTFVGPNKNEIDSLIDTDMIIRFNLKSDNADEFLADIKKESYFKNDIFSYEKIFCGKAAIQLKISKNTLPFSVFGEKGIFNESNTEIYTKYVNSSRTYFVNDTSDNQKHNCYECNNNSFKPKDIIPDFNDETDSFSSENKVAKFIDREYKRLLTTPRYYIWHKILKDQWTAMKSFSEYYQKNDKTIHCEFLNALQVALLHINQACSPVSETPYHNYFYAGSYNDLLMMYYGIIYRLFKIADVLSRADGTEQHDRKFAICFESTAKIHSTLYTKTSLNIKNDSNQERFIIFYLPYDNFWNYSDNIKYLIHEVFHYVAPYDRSFRGQKLIDIFFKKLLKSIFVYILTNHISGLNKKPEIIKDIITKLLEQYEKSKDRKDFYEIMKKEHFEFFEYPNPEWQTLYFTNNNIEVIVMDIVLFVKKFIIDNFKEVSEKANFSSNIKDITECINQISYLFSSAGFPIIKTELKLICTSIIDNINVYVKATKEAFCDFWAVNILNLNATEYIEWLFSAMDKTIYEGMSSQYWIKNDKNKSLYSFEPRIWLMLYFFLKKRNPSAPFNTKAIIQLIEKTLKKPNPYTIDISQELEKLNQNFFDFYSANTDEIDDLTNMAFFRQDFVFREIESCDTIALLRKMALQNLHRENINVNYIEEIKKTPTNILKLCCSSKNSSLCVRSSSQEPFYISSVEEYIHTACIISEQHNNRPLWYRGLCNKFYNLLPSIFRHCDFSLSLYANQANIIKYAYSLTSSFTDLWSLPIEQQTACLQHYGMATNLLDFSTDMLVSLYFALNPDNEKDKLAIANGNVIPVVYIFDPVNYSNAIYALKNESLNGVPNYHISPVLMDINNNLSEKNTYFLNDVSFEYLVEHTQKNLSNDYVPNIRIDSYPVPIIIQQTQPRIIAQSGTFIAYSLHTPPQHNGGYDYLDLLSIQNQYKHHFNIKDSELFLRPIYVNPYSVDRIQNELRKLNISSSKYYPELFNVFKEGLKNYNCNKINYT